MKCFQRCELDIGCHAASFAVKLKKNCFLYGNNYIERKELDWISYIKTGIIVVEYLKAFKHFDYKPINEFKLNNNN